jgi:hypothetical protein
MKRVKKTFEQWLKEVDKAIAAKTTMSYLDLPDQPYQSWYEEGVSPKSAAARAIRDA